MIRNYQLRSTHSLLLIQCSMICTKSIGRVHAEIHDTNVDYDVDCSRFRLKIQRERRCGAGSLYSRVAGTGEVLLRGARLVDDVVSAFARISHRLGFDGLCRCRLERQYWCWCVLIDADVLLIPIDSVTAIVLPNPSQYIWYISI